MTTLLLTPWPGSGRPASASEWLISWCRWVAPASQGGGNGLLLPAACCLLLTPIAKERATMTMTSLLFIYLVGKPPLPTRARPAPAMPAAVRPGTLRVCIAAGDDHETPSVNGWTPGFCARPAPKPCHWATKMLGLASVTKGPSFSMPLQPAPYWSPATMASGALCAQMHDETNGTPPLEAQVRLHWLPGSRSATFGDRGAAVDTSPRHGAVPTANSRAAAQAGLGRTTVA